MNPELLAQLYTEKESLEIQMLKVLTTDGGGGLQPLLAYWLSLNSVIKAAKEAT